MPDAAPIAALQAGSSLRAAVLIVAALNLAYGVVEIAVALPVGSVSLFADSMTSSRTVRSTS